MTREDLITLHEEVCLRAKSKMEAKNHDYAGATEDPFHNFRASAMFGIEPEMGVLVRCVDKFKRIQTFVKSGTLLVKDESLDDAIEDVINYMVLLIGLINERK